MSVASLNMRFTAGEKLCSFFTRKNHVGVEMSTEKMTWSTSNTILWEKWKKRKKPRKAKAILSLELVCALRPAGSQIKLLLDDAAVVLAVIFFSELGYYQHTVRNIIFLKNFLTREKREMQCNAMQCSDLELNSNGGSLPPLPAKY